MKDRRCTDLIFTILFLAFAGVCGWVCMEGFSKGDPSRLLSPVDYDGKLCGVDYPDHKYLYYIVSLDLSSSTTNPSLEFKAMCVKTCPLLNTTASVDCSPLKETHADCSTQIDLSVSPPTPLDGFVGYGTKNIFNKFCVPNLS